MPDRRQDRDPALTAGGEPRLVDAIRAARVRTQLQVDALTAAVRSIVEASELTSADDEHDPEGATIAYERAQATALLDLARADLVRLDRAAQEVETTATVSCVVCGSEIGVERIEALPTADRCIRCAGR